ncbi:MAG TPA: phosphohistidine phosphatase SixA [Candidatus Baltobacteraceae bacterium]|nr:phosphohistidine phosphatase SixA [Candidatus Baltobacteraceae bacterium]
MNIYVLRHGIAMEREEWEEKDDSKRPLRKEGEKQLHKISRALEKLDLEFDLILSSPYERAKRTAEIVAGELHLEKRLKFSDDLTPEGDPENLIAEINRTKPQPENLLLVGHEPYLSIFTSQLISENDIEMDFKKAGLCKLKIDALRFGRCAKLCWLLTPKQMELMA